MVGTAMAVATLSAWFDDHGEAENARVVGGCIHLAMAGLIRAGRV